MEELEQLEGEGVAVVPPELLLVAGYVVAIAAYAYLDYQQRDVLYEMGVLAEETERLSQNWAKANADGVSDAADNAVSKEDQTTNPNE